MNTKKLQKMLTIFIIVLGIILLITIPIYLIFYLDISTKKELKTNPCVEKGNICTLDDIIEGIEVLVQVSNNEEYIFNVISNDENSMTLLMNENIKKETNWHGELVNIKGPQTALNELVNYTKDWDKIDVITNYEYIDGGKTTFEEQCKNQTTEEGYDCTETSHISRGYNSIKINNGRIIINTNIVSYIPDEEVNNIYTLENANARARLITREEIVAITRGNGYPNWLVSNLNEKEGYWTLTSATSIKINYSQGAVAIAKKDNKTSIEDLAVMKEYEPKYQIGIRPVIVVNK